MQVVVVVALYNNMTITEIKAELYDLYFHTCNGRWVVNSENPADYTPCKGCSRIIELQAILRKQLEKRNDN